MAHDMPFDHDHTTPDEEKYWRESEFWKRPSVSKHFTYSCIKCGTPISAATADDQGGRCDDCALKE